MHRSFQQFVGYLQALLEERRATEWDDIISRMTPATAGDDRLTGEEMLPTACSCPEQDTPPLTVPADELIWSEGVLRYFPSVESLFMDRYRFQICHGRRRIAWRASS